MKSGGKTCMKCGCDMEDEEYEKGEKEEKEEMRSGGMACMKCGGKMHKSGGTVSSCMKCGGGKYTFGGKVNWLKKKVTSNSSEKYASGGMIKRADGSYSKRGLWDNIRANAGSGKEPTKQMLEQEKKIKQEMAVGGEVNRPCPPGWIRDPRTNECVEVPKPTRSDSLFLLNNNKIINDLVKNKGFKFGDKIPNDATLWKNDYNDLVDLTKQTVKQEINYTNREYLLNKLEAILKKDPGVKTGKYSDYVKEPGYFFGTRDYYGGGGEDINFPVQYIHPLITPQYSTDLTKDDGTAVGSHYYDDLAITPVDMLSKEQLKRRNEIYNPDGTYKVDPNLPPVPAMDYKDTVAGQLESMGIKPTYENRKKLAEQHGIKNYTGDYQQNMNLLDLIKADNERQKKEEQYRLQNPISEPDPYKSNEPEIMLYPETINMPTVKPGLIPVNNNIQMVNPTPWNPVFADQSAYQNTIAESTGMEMPNKTKKKSFSFGGAVSSMKKYLYGGEIDNTEMTTDAEMPLSKGAYDVPEPTYDASVVSNESPMQVTDNVTQGTEQLGYKEIVQSFQKKNIDKSLPNWGYAKQEQIKLNELIRKDISAGNAKMDILVEDDIIGDNTLRAMRAYEANGQYTRPEGFKDKWLAEYKKQWNEMQATGKSKANVPKDNNIIEQPKKAESKTMLDEFYNYFNPPSQKKKDKPVGYGTVLRPEETQPKVKSKAAKYSAEKYAKKSGGWPKASLLLEGGIEVSTSDLKRKDFDTYFPISGASKPGSKGVRATGRDNNKSFFDAVEKAQSKRKDGTNNNTSLQLIDKLLSSHKSAILIPKGLDKHGRDLNDIYLQDPFYPDKYHALDSLGVVEGEAIFGMDVEPKVGSLTKRQEEITKIANKKGGYKYEQSPYEYRKSKRY